MTITRDWRLETGDYKSGQSLIEVLVAFGVVVIVGMALITASLATQRTSISARAKSQATELAQQYLEQVRVIRDINGFNNNAGCFTIQGSQNPEPLTWTLTNGTLPSPQSGGCLVGSGVYIGEVVPLNNINYYRRVTFTVITANVSKKAVVDVNWKEGTNDRSISQETILSAWCGGTVSIAGSPCPTP